MTRTEYQNAPPGPYYGHPTHEHDIIAGWFAESERLRDWAESCHTGEQFADELLAAGITRTPDGYQITREIAIYVWEVTS